MSFEWDLANGQPSSELLARGARVLARRWPRAPPPPAALQYAPDQGDARVRHAVARHFSLNEASVLLTPGASGALALAARRVAADADARAVWVDSRSV